MAGQDTPAAIRWPIAWWVVVVVLRTGSRSAPGGELRTTGLSTADIQCASVNMQPRTRAGFLDLDTDFDREFIVPDNLGQREMPAQAPDCPSNPLKLLDKLRNAELGPRLPKPDRPASSQTLQARMLEASRCTGSAQPAVRDVTSGEAWKQEHRPYPVPSGAAVPAVALDRFWRAPAVGAAPPKTAWQQASG